MPRVKFCGETLMAKLMPLYDRLRNITKCDCDETEACRYLEIAKQSYDLGVQDAKAEQGRKEIKGKKEADTTHHGGSST